MSERGKERGIEGEKEGEKEREKEGEKERGSGLSPVVVGELHTPGG